MDIILPKPGKYVVAVSGGIDSVVLLDILAQRPGLELIVAHFDHGIREDSTEDKRLVEDLAKNYSLPFIYEEGKLGQSASEAVAREARYKFLRRVVNENSVLAIITAHHQDDLLETAIINLLRGTGRKGLTSLNSNSEVIRPLLNIPKKDLIKYALTNGLEWHEDSTNQDTSYLRNYIRHNILPKFNEADIKKLLSLINNMQATNQETDELLAQLMHVQIANNEVNRQWFNQLPHSLAKEFMAGWLRKNGLRDFDSATLERLATSAKTAAVGKKLEAIKGYKIIVGKKVLALKAPER